MTPVTAFSWRPRDIRARHRGLLLRLLDERGPLTRGEIAQLTGLSLPSVSAVAADLAEMGCLTEAGKQARTRRGRTGTMIGLAHDAYVVAGIALDVGRIQVGICDLSRSVIASADTTFRPAAGPAEAIDRAIAIARPLLRIGSAPLLGVGVTVPGSVDAARRRNVDSYRLGWHDVPVADLVERELGAAAVVEYNVRAIALAEAKHRPGLRDGSLLYLHVGTGVGVALTVGGEVVQHGVPQLGHHPMASGPRCACGASGCFEALVAVPYLKSRVADATRYSPILAHEAAQRRTVLSTLQAATEAGDGQAAAILAEFVAHLVDGLAIAVNLLSPSRVALGGILANAPGEVIDRIRAGVHAKACLPLRKQLTVERSELEAFPEVRGAAAVALDSHFFADGPQSARTAPQPRNARPAYQAVPRPRQAGSPPRAAPQRPPGAHAPVG